MKKWIFLLLVIAPLFYANDKRPHFNRHQQKIYQLAIESNEDIDEAVYSLPQWDGLEFVDWKIVTATRDKSKQSLVSYGIVDYIKVVDTDWAPKAFDIKSRDPESVTR
jgi:hypothetical protein